MHTRDHLIAFAEELIDEGNALEEGKWVEAVSSFDTAWFVDAEAFRKWNASRKLLLRILGPFADVWQSEFSNSKDRNSLANLLYKRGSISSLHSNLVNGRLASVEELVSAETFASILEQAEHLLTQGYYIAAGVLCRAVLEERLRVLCTRNECLPSKKRPTINDLAQALCSTKIFDKLALKSVDVMAAAGNAAAHNDDSLTREDVHLLYNNLIAFLQKFSL